MTPLPYDWVHLGCESAGTGSNTIWRVPGRLTIHQIEFELVPRWSAGGTAGYMLFNLARIVGGDRLTGVGQLVIAELTLRHFTDTDTQLTANKTVTFEHGNRITGAEVLYLNVYGDTANARPYGQAWIRFHFN